VSAAGSGSAYGVGSGGDGVPASGRDVSGGADIVLRSGLLVGKHDGNSAAYDMKSLGKHIEAVRSSIITYTHLSWMADDDYDLPSYRSQRTEHN
jgi:hypothetical protein